MLESGQQGKVAAVVVTCRLPCAAASPAQLPTWRVCPPFVCLHPTAAQSAQLLIPCTCLHLAIARLHTRLPTHPVTHTHTGRRWGASAWVRPRPRCCWALAPATSPRLRASSVVSAPSSEERGQRMGVAASMDLQRPWVRSGSECGRPLGWLGGLRVHRQARAGAVGVSGLRSSGCVHPLGWLAGLRVHRQAGVHMQACGCC